MMERRRALSGGVTLPLRDTDVSLYQIYLPSWSIMLGTTLSTSQLRPISRDRQHTVGRLSVLQPVVRVSSLVSRHSAEVPTI